ncbi:MAG: hypothetical protein KF767_03070 [Bdellovibrionaceae bacterium]|nr:hypothetical protein [Pseudobdellovibrionaceae bacterium]
MQKIEKELRFLKIYTLVATGVCAVLFGLLFRNGGARTFEEINVERINVIEKDGRLRMVLANKVRQHPGIIDGVTYEERRGQRPPGLMFFNERGDELGGLVFDGNDGMGQGGSLTFDKFRGDQTIQIVHEERPDGTYFSGIKMNDQNMPLNELIARQKDIAKLETQEAQDAAWQSLRDQGLLMAERVRIGKDREKSALIQLKDAQGKVRIEVKVEADGHPRMEFLDEKGKVTHRLPPTAK